MISIIIPWFNRAELKEALPNIIANAEYVSGNVTIVNFNGDREFIDEQVGNLKKKLKIIHVSKDSVFNKPAAQNIGAHYTNHDYLFFCDCDIYFQEPTTLYHLFEKVKQHGKAFGTLEGVKETKLNARNASNLVMFGYQLNLKIADGTKVTIIDNEEDASDGTRQAPGILLVKRTDFELIGGYNSKLDGWGWEDQDMICRLSLSAKLQRISCGKAMHISHDDESRMLGYKNYHDRWYSRDIMFRRALANYDMNNFMGTFGVDVIENTAELETC